MVVAGTGRIEMNHTPKYPGKVWENEYDLGFTWEDVKTLYYVARTLQFHTNLLDERLLNLSDRIEALLPPEPQETPQKGG